MMKKICLWIVFFLFSSTLSIGQQDSIFPRVTELKLQEEYLFDQYFKAAQKYKKVNQLDSAMLAISEALPIARALQQDSLLFECYVLIGEIHWFNSEPELASSNLTKAVEIVQSNSLKANGLLRLANNQLISLHPDSAKYLLIAARKHLGVDTLGDNMAEYYRVMGNYKGRQDNYLEAIECYLKAKSIVKAKGLRELINYELAGIYSRLDLYEKAVELDEENLALAKQDSAYVSQLYTYFGMIASAQDYGDYEKVKEIFDEANLLREQTGVSIAFGFLHYIMGLAQLDQNQVDAAVENFEKGIEISKAQKDESELFDCYLGLAMALRKKGEIEEPLRLATIVEETRTSFRPKLNKLLIDLYRTTNRNSDLMVQLEERYVYQEKFESERKDVVKQLVAAQLKQQQQTYELREQKQQSELQYEHRLNNLLWGLVAVVSVFCALLVYLLNQSRRQRRTIQLQKKELEEKSINLERANHKKDEVLAVIGHDLRGPIGGIKAVVDMTVDGDISSEELVDMFPELQKNTTAMYEILNNLLHWANIQMKGSKIDHQQSINARQEFQRVKNFLATLIQQKQIRFENNIQPTVIANGNLDDFNIIIRNLLSNAIKFTPEGGSIKVHALDGEHGLTFQVQDSGAGIAKEKLSSIFNTGTTTYGTDGEKGTGLGLNLCKALVKKNGGEIWVESQEGSGSSFFFTMS